jgi:protein-tyrosine phosphatase
MRAGFGEGVSIPSQLRYVSYVDEWANTMNKRYVERRVEILELHAWGLRDGVKVSVHSYVEDGRRIKCFHTFTREEKVVVETGNVKGDSSQSLDKASTIDGDAQPGGSSYPFKAENIFPLGSNWAFNVSTVIFKPSAPLLLPASDINIDFEGRNSAHYTGWTVVTSLAHFWFNAFFEGGHTGADSGIFEIDWEAMDGIKGSAKKGIKALDKLKVVWRFPKQDGQDLGKVIVEPSKGEPVQEPEAADWKSEKHIGDTAEAGAKKSDGVTGGPQGGVALTMGASMVAGADLLTKEFGLRKETPESTNSSWANSLKGERAENPMRKCNELQEADRGEEDEGVRALGPDGEEHIVCDNTLNDDEIESRIDTAAGKTYENSIGKAAHVVSKVKRSDD